jgi:hypothetical protein
LNEGVRREGVRFERSAQPLERRIHRRGSSEGPGFRIVGEDSRVVDQNVDTTANVRLEPAQEGFERGFVPDVQRRPEDLAAFRRGARFGDRAVNRFRVAASHDHGESRGREPLRDLETDAA